MAQTPSVLITSEASQTRLMLMLYFLRENLSGIPQVS